MNWETKARIQQTCARVPGGERFYVFIQKRFGTLDGDPTDRYPNALRMIT